MVGLTIIRYSGRFQYDRLEELEGSASLLAKVFILLRVTYSLLLVLFDHFLTFLVTHFNRL
jgi:hypothetical protein